MSFKVSKYVNSIDEAIVSINKGVEDLWLRDWSYKEIKILKEKIDQNLYEELSSLQFHLMKQEKYFQNYIYNYLQSRDVRGYKRFPTNWSPGSGKDIPKLNKVTHNLFIII